MIIILCSIPNNNNGLSIVKFRAKNNANTNWRQTNIIQKWWDSFILWESFTQGPTPLWWSNRPHAYKRANLQRFRSLRTAPEGTRLPVISIWICMDAISSFNFTNCVLKSSTLVVVKTWATFSTNWGGNCLLLRVWKVWMTGPKRSVSSWMSSPGCCFLMSYALIRQRMYDKLALLETVSSEVRSRKNKVPPHWASRKPFILRSTQLYTNFSKLLLK